MFIKECLSADIIPQFWYRYSTKFIKPFFKQYKHVFLYIQTYFLSSPFKEAKDVRQNIILTHTTVKNQYTFDKIILIKRFILAFPVDREDFPSFHHCLAGYFED